MIRRVALALGFSVLVALALFSTLRVVDLTERLDRIEQRLEAGAASAAPASTRPLPFAPPDNATQGVLGNLGTDNGDYRAHVFAGAPRAVGPSAAFKVLVNKGYVVGYSENRKDPVWVAFRLSPVANPPSYPRPSAFLTDPRTDARVQPTDYAGTGYDRGHMAPNRAVATCYGPKAQRESFLMSNICPQLPKLNRGIWENIEAQEITAWAKRPEGVWVIVGPIFAATGERLPSGVEVPAAFYRIDVDNDAGTIRMLAFIVPQGVKGGEPMEGFLTTVDEVERQTGLDLFADLPDDVEERVESEKAEKVW